MRNYDAIADFLLKEAETKESLRKRINESAFEYYTGRYLLGLIVALLIMGILLYMNINHKIPEWCVMLFAMSGMAQMESKRNSSRIDAMVKLSNAEKNEQPVSDL